MQQMTFNKIIKSIYNLRWSVLFNHKSVVNSQNVSKDNQSEGRVFGTSNASKLCITVVQSANCKWQQ